MRTQRISDIRVSVTNSRGTVVPPLSTRHIKLGTLITLLEGFNTIQGMMTYLESLHIVHHYVQNANLLFVVMENQKEAAVITSLANIEVTGYDETDVNDNDCVYSFGFDAHNLTSFIIF